MEFIDIEEKIQRKVRAIYESGLEVSCQRKKGLQATYSDFVKATMDSKVSKCCNGASEVSYDDNPLVQFLWYTVAPIISICSDKMKHFLKTFGVIYDEVYPFCQTFQKPDNFLKVYKSYVPQYFLCNVRNITGTAEVNYGNNYA